MGEPASVRQEKAEVSRYRQFKGVPAQIIALLGVGYIVYEILYILGYLSTEKIFLYPFGFRSSILGLLLAYTFLVVPATEKAPRDRLPWYEIPLILASLVVCGYIFVNSATILDHPPWANRAEEVLAVVTILLLIEAARRMVGMAIPLIAVFFFLYALYCNYFPGILTGRGYSLDRVLGVMYLSQDGVFGSLLTIVLVIIFSFILFAAFLRVTKAGNTFTDFAFALVGSMKGGPAKAAIIASGFFGMISGSAVANVAAIGSVTIPLMKKAGYKPYYAGAIEAVGSTGGQLMPPVMGAAAFIMADFLGISYAKVCIAAALPAILYYMGLYVMVHLEAVKTGLTGMPRQSLPTIKSVLKRGWWHFLPLGVLVYYLGVANYSAEVSALYATAALIVVSFFRKETRLKLGQVLAAFESTVQGMLDIVITCALIGVIMGSLSMTGMGLSLANGLVTLSGGHLAPLLVLAAGASYILGMGMPTTPCYILLATMVAPALTQLGVKPIAAHLFVFYFGMVSMITPPVAPAAIIAAGMAGAPIWKTGYQAMRLGIIILIIPFMFVYEPVLLLEGQIWEIMLAVIPSLIGVVCLGAAVEGFLLASANWVQRILLATAALMLIYPGLKTGIIGICLLGAVSVWQWPARQLKSGKALESTHMDKSVITEWEG